MSDSPYVRIAEKIDMAPMRAPMDESGENFHESFIAYLKLLYSAEEAELIQHLDRPVRFRSTQDVADASGRDLDFVEKILANMLSENRLLGMGNMYTLLPVPVLLNIHQFYPEVKPDDIEAAKLQRDFFFINGDYYKYYEGSKKGTPVFRTIPVEQAIEEGQKVLSAEEAHDFILNHCDENMALVPCPCRTRTEKLGIRECKDKFPIAACIMVGPPAMHFEMLGLGKKVTPQQAVEYFDEMVELGLVGQTDNALSGNSIICLCCDCCCSQLRGRTRWDNPDAILPSNFAPVANDDCVGCGTCVDRCFFSALEIDEDKAKVDPDKCIGCGVCTLACPQEALKLQRLERVETFPTVRELMKTIAKENHNA